MSNQPTPTRFSRPALVGLLILGLAWLAVTGFDWYMRFHWFQWQRSLLRVATRPTYQGSARPLSTNVVPARTGGDLTTLIAVPGAADRYAQPRDGYVEYFDEYGLPNRPPAETGRFPVVVVGDSFMLQGGPLEQRLAGRLGDRIGAPVYTMARPGVGPIMPLEGFWDHPVFKAAPPRVVVWGVLENTVGGYVFEGLLFRVMSRLDAQVEAMAREAYRSKVVWSELAPRRLGKRLPDTALSAQLARRGWTHFRYHAFGALTPDVTPSATPVMGHDMLFYTANLDSHCWTPEQRDLPRVVKTIQKAKEAFFDPRGIAWVILLIPDKETVYRAYLPPRAYPCGEAPPSCLDELETRLKAAGIPVVNLLPAYRQATREGRLLYWPDDTHWNGAGMEIAAEQLAGTIQPLLAAPAP